MQQLKALDLCPVASPPVDRLEIHDDGSRSLDAWDGGLVVGRHHHFGLPVVILLHEVQVVREAKRTPPHTLEMMVLGGPTKKLWMGRWS